MGVGGSNGKVLGLKEVLEIKRNTGVTKVHIKSVMECASAL
jgi:hypothetical protein